MNRRPAPKGLCSRDSRGKDLTFAQGRNLLKAIKANRRMSPATKRKAILGVRRRCPYL